MERKTPLRSSGFWRLNPITEAARLRKSKACTPGMVATARQVAARTVAILPEKFQGVLPRGYSVSNQNLVMARFEMVGAQGQALYGQHPHWGERETLAFLQDLEEGWLTELSAYMRWQLRRDPVANATFQHALVHLHHEAMSQLKDQ